MLRKKYWASLLTICCLFVVFAGCQNKDDADEGPEGAARVETGSSAQVKAGEASSQITPEDLFAVKSPPLPTEAELNALGPIREENRELLRFMPDNPANFAIIYPSKTIQAPYLNEYQDVAEVVVSQIFADFNQYFPTAQQIPFSNIKRTAFSVCPMKQQPNVDPVSGMYTQLSPDEMPTMVCFLELNEPVDDLLLLSIFNPFGDVVTETLKPVTVNGMKAYDMVPPTTENPRMERLVFINPTTVVFASGNISDVTRVFDSEPAQGAIPSRILRTDMQNGDLISLYSTEGVTIGFISMRAPYVMGRSMIMQFQNQQTQGFTEQDALDFTRKIRNMTIRLNLQTPESGNILQTDMELLSQANVEPLKKAIEAPVSNLTNELSLRMAQAQSQAANIPAEQQAALQENLKTVSFLIATLDELKVATSGSKVTLSLTKKNGFDMDFRDILSPVFTQLRKAKAAQIDIESMRWISLGINGYLQGNGRRYPNYATFGENGTPLLSWRVALLPYIGELELYNQFHLNEPWDSEHNRTLIAKIPKGFTDPTGQAPAGSTLFRMIGGPGSFLSQFPNGFSVSDLKFPRGTLYIVTVRPEQAVEWTRPEFLSYEPNTFSQIVKDVFAAMFCTGDVDAVPYSEIAAMGELPYWISGTISPRTAAEMEAVQRYQQYQQQMQMQQQNAPGMTPQPLPENPMSTGTPQMQPPTQPPMPPQ